MLKWIKTGGGGYFGNGLKKSGRFLLFGFFISIGDFFLSVIFRLAEYLFVVTGILGLQRFLGLDFLFLPIFPAVCAGAKGFLFLKFSGGMWKELLGVRVYSCVSTFHYHHSTIHY
jgi:hypothetical protein